MISTIVQILGTDYLGLNDATAEPMADVFTTKKTAWTFNSILPEILKKTKLPLPINAKVNKRARGDAARFATPLHDAAWWEEKTRDFDFTVEDKLDAASYNRILWTGIMGEQVPYPAERSGRDLRHNRKQFLDKYRRRLSQETHKQPPAATQDTSGNCGNNQ